MCVYPCPAFYNVTFSIPWDCPVENILRRYIRTMVFTTGIQNTKLLTDA